MTCDDGDVVGYRVEEIQRVLERRSISKDGELVPADAENVKYFLHRNVGASAWGLATHREARIIAISANTHMVTVLAYALAPPKGVSDSSDSSENISETIDELEHDWPSPRRRDHVIILQAETNIPAISFNNNGDDSSGRWLFSSSIDGKTLLWDLHRPDSPARIIQVGWCASTQIPKKAPVTIPGYCDCPDKSNIPHACWGAMFLDTQSAFEMSPEEELMLEPRDITSCFRDITGSNKYFTVKAVNYMPNYGASGTQEISDNEDDDSSVMIVQEDLSEELEETSSDQETEHNEALLSGADSDTMSIDTGDIQDTNAEENTDVVDTTANLQVPEDVPSAGTQPDSLFIPETQPVAADSNPLDQPLFTPQPPVPMPIPWPPPQGIADMVRNAISCSMRMSVRCRLA